MSNITIQRLQDAEAFFTKLQDKKVNEILFSIQCSFDEEVKDLDKLQSYEKNKLVNLINTKVNFNVILENIEESIEALQEKEGKA